MGLSWNDLKQIDIEEAVGILYYNRCGSETKPAVFYNYNGCPVVIDIDGETAERLLKILYTKQLYTQD